MIALAPKFLYAAATKVSAFVLRFLTAPAVSELQLCLDWYEIDRDFHDFLLRSMPPIKKLDLRCESGGEMFMEQFVDILTLLPSVSEFRVALPSSLNASSLLQSLSRTRKDATSVIRPMSASPFLLLPSLEHLDFRFTSALPSPFVDLVNTRWGGCDRTLKSVTLSECKSFSGGYRSRFPRFRLEDDLRHLLGQWEALKSLISEGLQF